MSPPFSYLCTLEMDFTLTSTNASSDSASTFGAIGKSKNIRHLHVYDYDFTDDDAVHLAEAIGESGSLVSIQLCGARRLNGVGGKIIANAVSRSLRKIMIYVCHTGMTPVEETELRDSTTRGITNRNVLVLYETRFFSRRDGDHAIGHRVMRFLI